MANRVYIELAKSAGLTIDSLNNKKISTLFKRLL